MHLHEEEFSDGGCEEVGYLRICNEVVEYTLPEISISNYLQQISECIELGKCSRGVPLSGWNSKRIVKTSPEKFLAILSAVDGVAVDKVFERTGSSRGYVLSNEALDWKDIFQKDIKMIGKYLDIVSWEQGAYLGVKVNSNAVVIPRNGRVSNHMRISPIPYEAISRFVPFVGAYSYNILRAYKKLLYSIEIVPRFSPICYSKGEKVECFRYRGSSRCPFSKGIVCPLRTLHRKPRIGELGGALDWIKSADEILEMNRPKIQHKADYLSSAYLLNFLASIAYILSSALKELAGLKSWKVDVEEAVRRAEEIRQLSMMTNNYKVRELAINTAEDLEIMASSPPSQKKTKVIIHLDNFPQRLTLLARLVRNDRIYSLCKPRQLSATVVEGYVRTFFPLLRGEISRIVSEKISTLLAVNGCIEAKDLSNVLSEELAEALLNLLHSKNLLLKKRGNDGSIFM